MDRLAQPMTLAQFRATHDAGGFTRVELVGHGHNFLLVADSRSGDRVVLVRNSDKRPREFAEAGTALRLVREVGFASAAIDLSRWAPDQGVLKS